MSSCTPGALVRWAPPHLSTHSPTLRALCGGLVWSLSRGPGCAAFPRLRCSQGQGGWWAEHPWSFRGPNTCFLPHSPAAALLPPTPQSPAASGHSEGGVERTEGWLAGGGRLPQARRT